MRKPRRLPWLFSALGFVCLVALAVPQIGCVEQSRKTTGFMQPDPEGPRRSKHQPNFRSDYKPATPEQSK